VATKDAENISMDVAFLTPNFGFTVSYLVQRQLGTQSDRFLDECHIESIINIVQPWLLCSQRSGKEHKKICLCISFNATSVLLRVIIIH
jgi:hypothetical protein